MTTGTKNAMDHVSTEVKLARQYEGAPPPPLPRSPGCGSGPSRSLPRAPPALRKARRG